MSIDICEIQLCLVLLVHMVLRTATLASRRVVRPLLAAAGTNAADWCSAFRTANARLAYGIDLPNFYPVADPLHRPSKGCINN